MPADAFCRQIDFAGKSKPLTRQRFLIPCTGAYLAYLPQLELHSDRFVGTFTPFRIKSTPFRNGHLDSLFFFFYFTAFSRKMHELFLSIPLSFQRHAAGSHTDASSSKYAYVSGVNSLSCASVRVLPESQYAKNSAKYSRLLLLACCFIGADAASRAYRSLCACGKPIVQSRKCPNSCRTALASET